MLNRQQLDQFHRDGLVVLRGVFGDDELGALWQATDQVQQEALAGRAPAIATVRSTATSSTFAPMVCCGGNTPPSEWLRCTPACWRPSASALATRSCRSTTRWW